LIRDSLDERGRREWAASEAMALDHGGIARVHRGTGIVPSTIGKGIKELRERDASGVRADEPRRVRRPGGGRRSKVSEDPPWTLTETDPSSLRKSDPRNAQVLTVARCAARARPLARERVVLLARP